MAIEAQFRVGPIVAADGTLQDPRLGKAGEVIIQDAHGRFFEAAYRGNLYIASQLVTGVAPGTALGTAPPLTLWNPPGSGKIGVITKASLGYISGTLGAGAIVYATNLQPSAAPSGGTAILPINAQIGNPTSCQIKAYTGSTVAATQTVVRPVWSMGPALATTAVFPFLVEAIADGDLLLVPGACLSLQGIAGAGTSPLVTMSLVWEEVPL